MQVTGPNRRSFIKIHHDWRLALSSVGHLLFLIWPSSNRSDEEIKLRWFLFSFFFVMQNDKKKSNSHGGVSECIERFWQKLDNLCYPTTSFFLFFKKKGNRRIGCLVTVILSLVPITSTAAWTIHVGGLLSSWATAIPSFEKFFVLALFEKHSTLKSVKQRLGGEGAWFCV